MKELINRFHKMFKESDWHHYSTSAVKKKKIIRGMATKRANKRTI